MCSTGGNFGQALAYAGRRRGFPVEVFVSAALDEAKLARVGQLASDVFVIDGSEERAKEAAREHTAGRPERRFVEDGRERAISEGAGTIAVELLASGPIDTLVVQVGDGALIGGVARWVKERSPSTRVVGVSASGSPAMFRSWREGHPVTVPGNTIASALAVARPVPESVARIRSLIDEFVLVEDAEMIDAMRIAARTLGMLLEPAGAAGIAAILRHDLAGEHPEIRVAKVDVDEEPWLALEHRVYSIPTVIRFDGGRETHRVSGAVPYERLLTALEFGPRTGSAPSSRGRSWRRGRGWRRGTRRSGSAA